MALPHRAALVPSSPSCLGLVCDKPGAQHIRGLRPSPPPFFPGFLTQSLRRQPGPQPPCSLWPRPLGSPFAALGLCFLICKEDLGPSAPPPGYGMLGASAAAGGTATPLAVLCAQGKGARRCSQGPDPWSRTSDRAWPVTQQEAMGGRGVRPQVTEETAVLSPAQRTQGARSGKREVSPVSGWLGRG